MVEKVEYRALIQPVPSLSEATQAGFIARYRPTETYICREAADFDAFLAQLRPPRVVVVSHAALLGEQRSRKLDRADNMAAMKAAIHKRGTYIVEASTDRRSDRHWAIMRKDGEVMCGRIAQGSKSALNGRKGAEPYNFSDKHMLIMLRIMDSPHYENDDVRIAAIKRNGVEPVPARTWLRTRLRPFAREQGLLDDIPTKAEADATPDKRLFVYFIQCKNAVKIGLSNDPKKRLISMATGNHAPLTLLGLMTGGIERERAIHSKFSSYRIRGEWFRLVPELKDFIRNNAKKH